MVYGHMVYRRWRVGDLVVVAYVAKLQGERPLLRPRLTDHLEQE